MLRMVGFYVDIMFCVREGGRFPVFRCLEFKLERMYRQGMNVVYLLNDPRFLNSGN